MADLRASLVTIGITLLWIVLSANVVMLNKYILSFAGFPFPVTLTLMHMVFCSACAWVLVKSGVTEGVTMDNSFYISSIMPIAALFAVVLWLGNAAYLTLSVATVQMLKAATPAVVFLVSLVFGMEYFSVWMAVDLLVVGGGAAVAAYGDVSFNPMGIAAQVGAIISESFRLCLIQILLQSRGIKLNPITTLYYVAPACAACLCLPFAALEMTKLLHATDWQLPAGLLLLSAVSAFALNVSVFLLIGKTSALTLNIAGFAKDWLLIAMSALVYGAPITRMQLGGYFVTFLGICAYNVLKTQLAKEREAQAASAAGAAGASTSKAGSSPPGPAGDGAQGASAGAAAVAMVAAAAGSAAAKRQSEQEEGGADEAGAAGDEGDYRQPLLGGSKV